MEFDVFTLCPTIEAFNRCKKDLFLVADFFNIALKKDVNKQILKEKLFRKLLEVGFLPRDSDDSIEVQSEEAVQAEDVNIKYDLAVAQDPSIVLKLKELDLLIKKQECEVEIIRLRVVERQADRNIQLCKLDLAEKHLAKKPVPIPRTGATSVSSPVTPASSMVTEDFSACPPVILLTSVSI